MQCLALTALAQPYIDYTATAVRVVFSGTDRDRLAGFGVRNIGPTEHRAVPQCSNDGVVPPRVLRPVSPMAAPVAVRRLDLQQTPLFADRHKLDEAAYRAAVADEDSYSPHRKRLFAAMCVLNVAMNYDAGLLPAVLNHVQDQFGFSYTEIGILGSLVYLGTMASCPLAGYLLNRVKQRKVLLAAVTGNAIGCFWMSLAGPEGTVVGKWNLYMSKFMIGLTQSSVMIYGPVWVDEFAPEGSTTTWMSLLQVNVVGGVVAGYVMGGVFTENIGPTYWRLCLFMQACLLSCYIPLFMFTSGRHINAVGGRAARIQLWAKQHRARLLAESLAKLTPASRTRTADTLQDGESPSVQSTNSGLSTPLADEPEDEPGRPKATLRDLLNSPLYLTLTFAMCGLYFEVTGIQFWATDYFQKELDEPKSSVITWFAIASVTAPTSGVVFGGWIVDRLGGYRDESGGAAAQTLYVCCGFGCGAVIFSIPAAIIMNFGWVMGMLWGVLFFGGCLLPAATGVCINAVAPNARSLSSSYAFLAYNLLGYASAPLICGWTADGWGLIWGWRVVVLSSILTLLMMVWAWRLAMRSHARRLSTPTASGAGAVGVEPVRIMALCHHYRTAPHQRPCPVSSLVAPALTTRYRICQLLNSSPPVSSIDDASDQALAAHNSPRKGKGHGACGLVTVMDVTGESSPFAKSSSSTGTAGDYSGGAAVTCLAPSPVGEGAHTLGDLDHGAQQPDSLVQDVIAADDLLAGAVCPPPHAGPPGLLEEP